MTTRTTRKKQLLLLRLALADIVQDVFVHEGQEAVNPAAGLTFPRPAIRIADPLVAPTAGRIISKLGQMILGRFAKIAEVVGAAKPPAAVSLRIHAGDKNGNKNAKNNDHNQQFNQRKPQGTSLCGIMEDLHRFKFALPWTISCGSITGQPMPRLF